MSYYQIFRADTRSNGLYVGKIFSAKYDTEDQAQAMVDTLTAALDPEHLTYIYGVTSSDEKLSVGYALSTWEEKKDGDRT